MQQLEQQATLFLKSTGIEPTEHLLAKITEFFQKFGESGHLIFKRSILYFYNKHKVVATFPSNSDEDNVYTFDGLKVTRIKPEYYTGGSGASTASFSSGFEFEYSNNNNNNNNNNNGNNNG